MRLSGACSNQSQLAVVRRAAEARTKLTIDPAWKSSRAEIRPRLGDIQNAVVAALEADLTAHSPREVQKSVEQRMNRAVSINTVGSFLSVAARCPKWPIARVGPGLYRATANSVKDAEILYSLRREGLDGSLLKNFQ